MLTAVPRRHGAASWKATMAEFEKHVARVIRGNGSIARGHMIEKCDFDRTNTCTLGWQIRLQGVAKTYFDEPVMPGLIIGGFGKDTSEMQVHTLDPSGKPAPRSFHIACVRD